MLDVAKSPIALSSDSEAERTRHSKHCSNLALETRAITHEDVQRVRALYKRPAADLFRPKTKGIIKKPAASASRSFKPAASAPRSLMVLKKKRGERTFWQLLLREKGVVRSVACFCPKKLNIPKHAAEAMANRISDQLADFQGTHSEMKAHALLEMERCM